MALLAYGINHRTASVDLRSRLAFTPDQLQTALQQLRTDVGLQEAAILSTCNRTEVYCALPDADSSQLVQWLGRFHALPIEQVTRSAYEYWDEAAVRHLIRVAAGLDSMVLGEPQIFGQLKGAYQSAQQAATSGRLLGRWFEHSFSAAKRIRTDTGIGANPVSVAYASVRLARRIFSRLEDTTVLLIGAGETVELLARHLVEQGVKRLLVANRTLSRANTIAETFNGRAILLNDLPLVLHEADIVISSTASPLPILGKGAVEHALKLRRHTPMFMVDIAMPRDIEPEVGELADVYLYTVDDLQQVVEENRRQRQSAAAAAESLAEEGARGFMDALKVRDASHVVRSYRSAMETVRDQEIARALQQLANGADAEAVIQRLGRNLTNKLMHAPTAGMKAAIEQGQLEQLDWAKQLLDIPASDGNSE